ncbi:hypothetical protein Q763_16110 [Flavobacterium beibuense F44-8]|uniref:Lipoprotein n=1 Tax=Flavobacterium beibuense F44-8 TaxID=1406840 RepID=A0A0A2LI93_9FLAO|nr:hypothetical protein [Flavobacterium beibuense]KGO78913.1 hypothetical protein Q763_16110 [Flavobacterium beibuense F44-8]
MKKTSLLFLVVCLVFISCSEDKEQEPVQAANPKNVHVIHDDDPPSGQGDIPRNKLVYKTFDQKSFTLNELWERYKSDVEVTAPDYHDNLKNFWFSIIGDRVIDEGSDAMKLYFLDEQMGLEQNLLNYDRFFSLLATCPLTDDEVEMYALDFFDRNREAINGIMWKSEEEKKDKLNELAYMQRTFFLLRNSNKG